MEEPSLNFSQAPVRSSVAMITGAEPPSSKSAISPGFSAQPLRPGGAPPEPPLPPPAPEPPPPLPPLPPPRQFPAEHACPALQVLAQAPQLAGSFMMSTQTPAQVLCPPGQPHAPLAQVCPPAQRLLQNPQLVGSDVLLTQLLPQASSP